MWGVGRGVGAALGGGAAREQACAGRPDHGDAREPGDQRCVIAITNG